MDQSVLSGNAGKKISATLPLSTCITNTRPEYAKYFHGIGMGKKRELCVLSKVLTMQDMIASQQPVLPKHIPKWIPRQFLSVSSQVLLNRITILLRDV